MAKSSWHTKWDRAPRAERTDRAGNLFASKAELSRWEDLQRWQITKEIRNLKRQVKYELRLSDGTAILTPAGKVSVYTADFVYERRFLVEGPQDRGIHIWKEIVEDVKGYRDKTSTLRIAVFEAIYKRKVLLIKG